MSQPPFADLEYEGKRRRERFLERIVNGLTASLVVGLSIVYSTTALSSEMELQRLQEQQTTEAQRLQEWQAAEAQRLQEQQVANEARDAVKMAARVSRIQSLATECAAIAVKDIEGTSSLGIRADQAVVWLALTGDRDPDDSLVFTNERVTDAIVDDCYVRFYRSPKYDDVREYMREH